MQLMICIRQQKNKAKSKHVIFIFKINKKQKWLKLL